MQQGAHIDLRTKAARLSVLAQKRLIWEIIGEKLNRIGHIREQKLENIRVFIDRQYTLFSLPGRYAQLWRDAGVDKRLEAVVKRINNVYTVTYLTRKRRNLAEVLRLQILSLQQKVIIAGQ